MADVVYCSHCRREHRLDELRNQRRQYWADLDLYLVGECPAHTPGQSLALSASQMPPPHDPAA